MDPDTFLGNSGSGSGFREDLAPSTYFRLRFFFLLSELNNFINLQGYDLYKGCSRKNFQIKKGYGLIVLLNFLVNSISKKRRENRKYTIIQGFIKFQALWFFSKPGDLDFWFLSTFCITWKLNKHVNNREAKLTFL